MHDRRGLPQGGRHKAFSKFLTIFRLNPINIASRKLKFSCKDAFTRAQARKGNFKEIEVIYSNDFISDNYADNKEDAFF